MGAKQTFVEETIYYQTLGQEIEVFHPKSLCLRGKATHSYCLFSNFLLKMSPESTFCAKEPSCPLKRFARLYFAWKVNWASQADLFFGSITLSQLTTETNPRSEPFKRALSISTPESLTMLETSYVLFKTRRPFLRCVQIHSLSNNLIINPVIRVTWWLIRRIPSHSLKVLPLLPSSASKKLGAM